MEEISYKIVILDYDENKDFNYYIITFLFYIINEYVLHFPMTTFKLKMLFEDC
jgi:hypothetical protein